MRAIWMRPRNPKLDATKIPTAIDIAWTAGIYEGEGTCRNAGKSKRGLMVQVVQKDAEILYRLRDWFGGSIQFMGAANGCHTWNACGDRARIFLALVYSFLSARRRAQVEHIDALAFMGGQNLDGVTQERLQEILGEYYARHHATTRRGKAELRMKAAAQVSAEQKVVAIA
jgi:hypothetical protein